MMSLTQSLASATTRASNNNDKINNDQQVVLLSLLPKTKGLLGSSSLSLYQGFWCPSIVVPNIISFQTHFQADPQDIIIASHPKCGTTWLKALVFSIVNRALVAPESTSLLTHNPHQLVPFAEFTIYADAKAPDIGAIPSPRLLSTHIPYASLPESIKNSRCPIIYICRNPLDVVVSSWHFGIGDDPERHTLWTMEEYVEKFCQGECGFGPFWSHVLGFWKASLDKPKKVLFLKYEDVKRDTLAQAKSIAEFIGFPFSDEEDSRGFITQILNLCSFDNLKNLDVNKNGKFMSNFENKSFFRKGEVGDWVNHLSPGMAERISKVIEEKLSGSGLTFTINI